MMGDLAQGPPNSLDAQFFKDGVEVTDPSEWGMHGSIYYDGSCKLVAGNRSLSRAAWAAVEVDEHGVEQARLCGAVPRAMPQTAQSAEYMARCAAVETLDGPSTLTGDCLNVVRDANLPIKHAFNKKRMHAAHL